MNRADILYAVQGRLIADLTMVVGDVKAEHGPQLKNQWVFPHLDQLLKGLRPKRVEGVSFNRSALTTELKKLADAKLGTAQKHVPEVTTHDVHLAVENIGDLAQLLYLRGEKELAALELHTTPYTDAASLVTARFDTTPAFPTRQEHEKWVGAATDKLDATLKYLETLGQTLAAKSGLMWKGKVTLAKAYLKRELGISLDLQSIAADVSVARKAILGGYRTYETRLMQKRYG